MSKEKKRPRVSLIVKVGVLLFGSAVIIIGSTAAVGGRYRYEQSVKGAASTAKEAVNLGKTILEVMDPDRELETDEDLRDSIHDTFRMVCEEVDVKYLYLYKLKENGERYHLISAALEDKDDEFFNATAGFGAIRHTPVGEEEKVALSGNAEGSYGFVDNEYGNVLIWVCPIFDEKGDVYALLGADYSMEEILQTANRRFLRELGLISALFVLTIVVSLYLINSSILRPIKELSLQMGRFLRDRSTKPVFGERPINDEITDVGHSFDKMTEELRQYLSDVERLTKEKVAGEVELSVAQRIQEGMVRPETSIRGTGFEIAAFMHPAKEIGGDFYDVIPRDDGRTAFVIGDVSGKGVTAAIFMVLVRTLIRDRILMGRTPAQALRESNSIICGENPEGMFATVLAGVYEPGTGKMFYANAGHTRPFLFGNGCRELETKSGIALGLFEDADIYDEELILEEDSGILLYTDGVSEAINEDKIQFGEKGIIQVSGESPGGAGRTLAKLKEELSDFTGGAAQFDDITVMVLYRKKHDGELRLKPELSEFEKVKERIITEMPDPAKNKNVILACEEWFANLVMHSKAEEIFVRSETEDDTLIVEFEDNGIPFDPIGHESEDKEFEDYDQGGMGIIFIKSIASDVRYARENNKNRVTMVFRGEEKK